MAGIVEIGESGNSINKSLLVLHQALRDTEYTHPKLFEDEDPYVYHCGIDIFNNHRLRSNDFVYIDKVSSGDTTNKTFNTISDVVRDREGNKVRETVSYIDSAETKVHIYDVDSIMTMDEAFTNGISEENGWYGFINKTDIDIPNAIINDEEVSINKVMNNNKACEFIDLYPDRSLFSFIPKVNKYRNRIEKNWDYCITYPAENDYAKYNEVVGLLSGLTIDEGGSSVKVIDYELFKSQTGNIMVRLKSMFKHTLINGNYVKLYYKINDELNEINRIIKVVSTGKSDGTEKDRYFTIKFSDIAFNFDIEESGDTKVLVCEDNTDFDFYYKKNINNIDCQYYLRKFKKIKNDDKELSSDINKLAYGENIYGDRLAQIVFTDDIDVDGLVDNNGRPLTEIYFTIIKRNAGHNIWYSNGNITGDTIEFSHCFGEVTSGFDLPEDEKCKDYNVRRIHNIDVSGIDETTIEMLELSDSPKCLENDITIDDDEFYGDIVELNPLEYTETVLEVVHHRFNTAQREVVNDSYKNILYDRLQYDDYDTGIMSDATGFTVITEYLNEISSGNTFYGNLNPEGYFYNPFTRIQIREESSIVSSALGTVIKCSGITSNSINTMIDYKIMKGDSLCFYNIDSKETKWFTVKESSEFSIEFWTDEEEYIEGNVDNTIVIKTDVGVPIYAKYIPSTHTFIWRGIMEFSELTTTDNLYDMPFANGCFYIHDNINFFLRRQDPNGEFGLLPINKKNPLYNFIIPGYEKIDVSDDVYVDINKEGSNCY